MKKPEGTLLSHKVNARFEKVELKRITKMAAGWDGKLSMALASKLTGGDWIGGNIHVTADTIHFQPDFVSRMAVKNAEDVAFSVPLSEVTGVSTRWVIANKAVDLSMQDGSTLSFLATFGTTKLAERIEELVSALPRP